MPAYWTIGLWVILALLGGCCGDPSRPPQSELEDQWARAENPEPRFGQFVARPGDIINVPGVSLYVYGITYGHPWPVASFGARKSFPNGICALGEGGVQFVDPLERGVLPRVFTGEYQGLRFRVEELGRDLVTVEIEPYDPVVIVADGAALETYELHVGDRLEVPGGFLVPNEIDHERGTYRLWHHPEGGQVHGMLNKVGRPPRNLDFPRVELGVVEFTEYGITIEVAPVQD